MEDREAFFQTSDLGALSIYGRFGFGDEAIDLGCEGLGEEVFVRLHGGCGEDDKALRGESRSEVQNRTEKGLRACEEGYMKRIWELGRDVHDCSA